MASTGAAQASLLTLLDCPVRGPVTLGVRLLAEDVVGFPDMSTFPESQPGPYERRMGGYLMGLLGIFAGRVPDQESHARVAELAATPRQWSAGHAVFDEIRRRLLVAMEGGDAVGSAQYALEESCCQAVYNATDPKDPFDPSSAFFVVVQAVGLASLLGVPLDTVAQVFTPDG